MLQHAFFLAIGNSSAVIVRISQMGLGVSFERFKRSIFDFRYIVRFFEATSSEALESLVVLPSTVPFGAP